MYFGSVLCPVKGTRKEGQEDGEKGRERGWRERERNNKTEASWEDPVHGHQHPRKHPPVEGAEDSAAKDADGGGAVAWASPGRPVTFRYPACSPVQDAEDVIKPQASGSSVAKL